MILTFNEYIIKKYDGSIVNFIKKMTEDEEAGILRDDLDEYEKYLKKINIKTRIKNVFKH